MMNIRIEIENFKSIINTSIDLKTGLNVLIGQNGAGKTCVLSALKFIKHILTYGVGLAMAKGGGQSRIYHRGKKSINFKVEFNLSKKTVKNRKRDTVLSWVLTVEQKGRDKNATISFERIQIVSNVNGIPEIVFNLVVDRKSLEKPKTSFQFEEDYLGKDLFDNSIHVTFEGNNSKAEIHSEIKKIIQEVSNRSKTSSDSSVFGEISSLDSTMSKVANLFTTLNEYNIIPERARQATEQIPTAKMEPNGYGISEVISSLESKNFHKLINTFEFFESDFHTIGYRRTFWNPIRIYNFSNKVNKRNIENAFTKINKEINAAVKPISHVSVKIDDSTGRRFVVFKAGRELFFPDEVSDGTIKWLCIVTSIYTGYASIYLLEEPENFLHPWMQQRLVQIMREQAEKSETIFLLTTHSTTLLNSCYPDEIKIIEQGIKGTKISTIKNLEEVDKFLNNSDFKLGDLWVSGGLGAIPE